MAQRHWARPIDFFARHSNYIDHMAPIYLALDESVRGSFYVPAPIHEYALRRGIEAVALKSPGVNNKLDVMPPGSGPVVTAAYGDLQAALRNDPRRPQIFMQHGIGLTFMHTAYAGGAGMQRDVSLFLDPNEHTRALIAKTFPHKPGFVIGTPKMDKLSAISFQRSEGKPVVCISFHWDGSAIAPEAGNALKHYAEILPVLAKQEKFTVIGHGHPRIMPGLDPYLRSVGIEPVCDFEEVMQRADVYVNDCSSTLYEFLVTGKPVIILNAPHFRRGMHTGIRFWEYTDVGPMVDEPGELLSAIGHQLSAEGNAEYAGARAKAVAELYPYLGKSSERAAQVIEEFVASKGPVIHKIERVHDETIGILYMCFGSKAAAEVRKSMTSLRNLGVNIPVCVVGDTAVKGAQWIEWTGEYPFDASQRENFQFRAGRIKPHLVELTPFERTLYIDADTEFMSDIVKGFEFLDDHDLALAEELLTIGQLYNKERAGWEINIQERDQTIKELGGDANQKFLNSGVLFFRKSEQVRALFQAWGRQWLRYQQWDEQLALMRAMHECAVKYKALSVDWNHPHRNKARIIFHNYGRGVARTNVNRNGVTA